MRKIIAALLVLSAAACSGERAAPLASGPWTPLNAAQWDVNPALVTAPAMPEAKS